MWRCETNQSYLFPLIHCPMSVSSSPLQTSWFVFSGQERLFHWTITSQPRSQKHSSHCYCWYLASNTSATAEISKDVAFGSLFASLTMTVFSLRQFFCWCHVCSRIRFDWSSGCPFLPNVSHSGVMHANISSYFTIWLWGVSFQCNNLVTDGFRHWHDKAMGMIMNFHNIDDLSPPLQVRGRLGHENLRESPQTNNESCHCPVSGNCTKWHGKQMNYYKEWRHANFTISNRQTLDATVWLIITIKMWNFLSSCQLS